MGGGSITEHRSTVTGNSGIANSPSQTHQNQTPSDIEGNVNEALTLFLIFSLRGL